MVRHRIEAGLGSVRRSDLVISDKYAPMTMSLVEVGDEGVAVVFLTVESHRVPTFIECATTETRPQHRLVGEAHNILADKRGSSRWPEITVEADNRPRAANIKATVGQHEADLRIAPELAGAAQNIYQTLVGVQKYIAGIHRNDIWAVLVISGEHADSGSTMARSEFGGHIRIVNRARVKRIKQSAENIGPLLKERSALGIQE